MVFVQDLVPESCCRIISFSSSYKEPFVCNFLGLSVGVELPPHVVASELHVLLDILPPLGRHYSKLSEEVSQEQQQHVADPLKHYKLMVYSAAQRITEQKRELEGWKVTHHNIVNTADPVFLQRLVTLLSGDLSDKLIDRGVISLKEEWMKSVPLKLPH